VTIANVVNIARQMQTCRGPRQNHSVTERQQNPDPASARYLIASHSAWARGAKEQQPQIAIIKPGSFLMPLTGCLYM
jgi:hypothetical protein